MFASTVLLASKVLLSTFALSALVPAAPSEFQNTLALTSSKSSDSISYVTRYVGAFVSPDIIGYDTSFAGMSGGLRVPKISIPAGGDPRAIYRADVYLGLYTSDTDRVVAGVSCTISNGNPSYVAFYSWSGHRAVTYNVSVAARDSISITINITTSTTARVAFANPRTNQYTGWFDITLSSGNGLAGKQAVWLFENLEPPQMPMNFEEIDMNGEARNPTNSQERITPYNFTSLAYWRTQDGISLAYPTFGPAPRSDLLLMPGRQ